MEPLRIEPSDLTPQPQNLDVILKQRRTLIEIQLRRIAFSAKHEEPDEDMLFLQVEDALRLWKEIPNGFLPSAVDEAIIQAGSFEATTGLVAKCWREGEKKELHIGDGNRPGIEDTQKYLAWVNSHDEKKASPEFVHAFCEQIQKALK